MLKSDPCSCGSLYFRDWHLLSSSWMWPRDHLYAPDLQAFLTSSVLAVDKPRGETQAWSFLPDLLVRFQSAEASSAICARPTWRPGARSPRAKVATG